MVLGVCVLLAVAGTLFIRDQRRDARAAEDCQDVRAVESEIGDARDRLAAGEPVVAFYGDSYTQGMAIDDPLDAYPYATAELLDIAPVVDGVGGSGFVAAGPCGDAPLGDRLQSVPSGAEVVVVQAGLNDLTFDGEREQKAAESALADAGSRGAVVVALGTFTPPGADVEDAVRTSAAIEAAAEDAGAVFVDVADWDFETGTDDIHPTARGHRQIAEQLAPVLADLLH